MYLLLILLLILPLLLHARFNAWDVLDPLGVTGQGQDGLDIFGTRAQGDAANANKKNLKKIGNLYTSGMGDLGTGYGAALARQKLATGTLKSGFKAGLGNILTQGNEARSQALLQQRKALAGTEADLSGAGIINPALMSAARRASAFDTSHAVAGIDEAIANLAGQFQLQGSGAIAGSQGQEGNLLAALAGQRSGLTQGYMGILGNVQHTAGQSLASQIAGPLAFAISDLRTKKNAVQVGEVDGIPIYEFEYKGPFSRMLPGRWRGAMAQDLGRFPGAVRSVRGVLFVENEKIPTALRVQKVA